MNFQIDNEGVLHLVPGWKKEDVDRYLKVYNPQLTHPDGTIFYLAYLPALGLYAESTISEEIANKRFTTILNRLLIHFQKASSDEGRARYFNTTEFFRNGNGYMLKVIPDKVEAFMDHFNINNLEPSENQMEFA